MADGFTCFWRIENFDLWNPFTITSPQFHVKMFRDTEWNLELRPTLSDSVGVYLFKKEPIRKSNIDVNISRLAKPGWRLLVDNQRKRFRGGGTGFGTHDVLNWSHAVGFKTEYLFNGSLTLSFNLSNGEMKKEKSAQVFIVSRITGKDRVEHLPVENFQNLRSCDFLNFLALPMSQNAVKESKYESKTLGTQTDLVEVTNILKDSEDIIRLFKHNKFQYVTLQTGTREFSVHKALLSARSPVFNAMFDKPMRENNSNIVEINDIDNDTLSLMLKFLHFETLPDLKWNEAVQLYYAAEKYQIEMLKTQCQLNLKSNLSLITICDAFVISDMHNDITLRYFAQEYFNENSKFILRSSKWKDLLTCKPELASEILLKFSDKL